MNYLSVGHITEDQIEERTQFGGSALYGARAAARLGFSASVWTSTVPKGFQESDLKVFHSGNPDVTTFRHHYPADGSGREIHLVQLAPPLKPEDLTVEKSEFDVVMLAPVWDEVQPEAVKWFHGSNLGLTPQGWFRRKREDESVFYTSSYWDKLPGKIKLIVVSEEDISGDMKAWDWMREYAQVAVLTQGRKGHSVSIDGYTQDLTPPFIAEEKDPTGAGDVFAATLLLLLSSGIEPFDAVQFSSLAASFVVESPGLEGLPLRTDLLARYQAVVARDPLSASFKYPRSF